MPELSVALGATAGESLLGEAFRLTSAHGRFCEGTARTREGTCAGLVADLRQVPARIR